MGTSGLVYILGEFPALSQTFIMREIGELCRQGLAPDVWYLRPARRRGRLSPQDEEIVAASRRIPAPGSPALWAAAFRLPGSTLGRRALSDVFRLDCRDGVRQARVLLNLARAAAIAGEVCASGAKHIHAHFATSQTEVALGLHLLTGIPFSFTAHARDIYVDRNALPEKILRAASVVTCTGYNRAHLVGLCPVAASSIHHVPHGIELPPTLASPSAPTAARPRILGIGRLVPKKGFTVLVEALARLGPSVEGRLVGDGPERSRLASAAAAAGVNLAFAGEIPPGAIPAELAASRVLVMPSVLTSDGDRDGIPNVIIEAMAAGLPVVASSISGIPEVVEDGVTGLLVPPGDAAALAAAIARIVADPQLGRRLGEAGRVRVRERCDLERVTARLRTLFELHLRGAAPPRRPANP